MDRDGHDGNTDALRDSERAAEEGIDLQTARRPLGKVQDRDSSLEQAVHAPEDARTCAMVVTPDPYDAECGADRSDQWPTFDLRLCERRRRTDGQDRERVDIADVVCDDQCGRTRHITANCDRELVRPRNGTDSTREAVNRGKGIARRRHARGSNLREQVEQAATGVASCSNKLDSDHA